MYIIGTLIWKWWENQTPADEQFSVVADSNVGEEHVRNGNGGGGGGNRDGEDFDLGSSLLSRFDESSSDSNNDIKTKVKVNKGTAATRLGAGFFSSSSTTNSTSGNSKSKLDDSLLASAYDSLLLSPVGRDSAPKQDLLSRSRSEVMGLVAKFQMESAASNYRRDEEAKRKEKQRSSIN